MTTAGPRIDTLSFLTPGNYPDDDPAAGLADTLRLFEFGEALGVDGAWIRQRHLEHGVGSAAVFLAAAAQRTSRVELGAAVIPIGYESPFRLAEDLSMADVLAGGRLHPGFSAGVPPHAELLGDRVFDGDWRTFDLSYGRIERLMDNLRGEYLGGPDTVIHSPGNIQRPRLQPYSPGLRDRLWYGGGSLRSVRWAGAAGLNLLTGNVVIGERSDDFTTTQRDLIAEYRRHLAPGRPGRVAVGRVIVPLDGADRATRDRYRRYAESRHERTLAPQGERRVLFAPDLVGTAAEIVDRLAADPVLGLTTELRLELPYEFHRRDYEQILHDTVELVAPALGWTVRTPAHAG
ncbi:Flavin-dependent oxidoreductase, luciferase family (includes alkanesulfonate monooxygenase SsuD and methylene tetrahydromethanopterin reductase) [Nocardia farcinica]|uniref:Limonene 1,2-monooxygenase n=1 Tax=Nocardia farcinica TaxID=37329 RepID=A0A0H5NGA1_NOCFR|nr:LLM class flavin-dependent oxidoreductase [Nocardia farcinica]AXK84557.1 LLM class flavin-dependent oxidoreductase [Nocardia farcinica]CRY74945.1 Limonene 1%2C2-monooxygenase [Nocardia farcinica]SIS62938.1 Flavin-dependent oxidoreductase, luciferase family (includes alkanesulfonate monooxygenase SsuD and methylene tetrahydromethanopterin reductase) [Nocardia farcinica]